MALALEAGSEQYARLPGQFSWPHRLRIVTVFLVPSAYLLIHRRIEARRGTLVMRLLEMPRRLVR